MTISEILSEELLLEGKKYENLFKTLSIKQKEKIDYIRKETK